MATALVIGGSGQIGRAVVPALLGDGWDVRVLARHEADVGGARLVLGDRDDPDALDEALAGGVDVVVDVVAYDDRQAAPLIERADRIGSAVVVSSAAVYVDGAGDGFESEEFGSFPVPVTEDQPTVGPGRDTYATGKVALEQAWSASPVPTTILRPGAIHGPGCLQPREWTFVKRVLDGRDVRVLAYDGLSRFHTTATAVLGELVRLSAQQPGDRVLNAADPRRSRSPRSPRPSTRRWERRRASSPSRASRWTASGSRRGRCRGRSCSTCGVRRTSSGTSRRAATPTPSAPA